MKLAVIGLGIGKVHAQVIHDAPDFELAAVCDLDEARVSECASRLGTRAYTDWQQMVNETRPDGVCLCTNPKSHLPLGSALAGCGVNVLCEKPMAPNVEQCLALAEACERAGVTLMIAQKKRFAPAIAFLKEHLNADFGKPLSLNYRYHPGQVPMNWFWQEDDGGGPILENAVHVFDTLRYLIGDVKTVRGIGGNILNPDRAGQVDLALGLLEFENGCVGAVELGTASEWAMADEEFYLACEHTVVRSRGGFDRPSEILYLNRAEAKPQTFCVDYEGAKGSQDFEAEIRHFVECIQKQQQPLITGRDAAKSIAVCQAMKRAVREGTTVEL
ncbi:MAG: Gfo/Idh/MocA family oxidoreductase [Armatimonadia bacterium]